MIPAAVETYIKEWLSERSDEQKSARFVPIGGGSINDTYQVQHHSQKFFLKVNGYDEFPDLFDTERQGLALLAAQQKIRVPKVLEMDKVGTYQVLLMEWIEQGSKTELFWKQFGEQLAALHQCKATSFGLYKDNYMGSLPQQNAPMDSWAGFFIQRRLQPQVALALQNGMLTIAQAEAFDNLYAKLPKLFADEPPCLLHGDLWSGNYLCDENSNPVLIDPAVYYGHRSVDLAMTTLFGGFDTLFYESYRYHYPLPANYEQQWEVCNLYPLLVHLNLFGQSYLADILRVTGRY